MHRVGRAQLEPSQLPLKRKVAAALLDGLFEHPA